MKLQRSTFQLLRLPFSFFLMPVYWFALGQVVYKDPGSALLVFFLVHHGRHLHKSLEVPPEAMIASSLLIGGFYPLTQLYQHEAVRKDGVRTMSLLLGYRGSFIFTGIVYSLAFTLLAHYFIFNLQIREFFVLATCMLPVLVYFVSWAVKVWKDPGQANFKNTMRINLLASLCTNAGFITIFLMS